MSMRESMVIVDLEEPMILFRSKESAIVCQSSGVGITGTTNTGISAFLAGTFTELITNLTSERSLFSY